MPTTRRQSGNAFAVASPSSMQHQQGLENRKRKVVCDDSDIIILEQQQESTLPLETPRRTTKKVRFSEDASGHKATGLTPYVRRATLSPKRTNIRSTPRGRGSRGHSLPTILPTPPSSPFANTRYLHVTPLRQVIDDRSQRRMRRSHLSETQNDLNAEDRRKTQANSEEIERLRAQLRDASWELESQRQLGINVNEEDDARVKALEAELSIIKREMADNVTGFFSSSPPPTTLQDNDDIEQDNGMICADDIGDNTTWEDEGLFSSPTATRSRKFTTIPSGLVSPGSTILCDDTVGNNTSTSPSKSKSTADASTQATLRVPDLLRDNAIQSLSDTIASLTNETTAKSLSLASLHEPLTSLGFSYPDESNPLEAVTAIHDLVRSVRLDLENLLPGETASPSAHLPSLLSELLRHVTRLLSHVSVQDQHLARVKAEHEVLRGQFDRVLAQKGEVIDRLDVVNSHRTALVKELADMETRLESLRARVVELENDIANKDGEVQILMSEKVELVSEKAELNKSIQRLGDALGSYRNEVARLEKLVGELETSGATKDLDNERLASEVQVAKSAFAEQTARLDMLEIEVGEKLFEIGALFKPQMANVTRRSASGREAGKRDGEGNEEEVRKGSKRDSGVAMEA